MSRALFHDGEHHPPPGRVIWGETPPLSVEEPVQEARENYRIDCWLLGREKLVNRPLRLLGLGVSGLREAQTWQQPLVFPA